MQSSIRGLIAFRISGAIAVLLSLIPVAGAIWSILTPDVETNWPLELISIGITLVPGILASLGRSVLFLPVAWGWLLSGYVPRLLEPPKDMLLIAAAKGFSMTGPYAYWATLFTIAAVGLWFYLVGVFQQDHYRKS